MARRKRISLALMMAICGLMLCRSAQTQEKKKPLTNADVVKMVKGGVPESVIIASIQAGPTNFDVSPDALVSLHKSGLTQNELNAVMAASNNGPSNAPAADSEAAPTAAMTNAAGASQSRLPAVSMMQGGSERKLPIEKTQVVQTKTKPTSMSSLASDMTLGIAVQTGVDRAAMGTMNHTQSPTAGMAVGATGGLFGSMLAHRKQTLTFVWAIPNPASANEAASTQPEFNVNYADVPGLNADEFEPVIVKLTPAQNAFRLVGATQGKQDATSDATADWEIYSHFLEERVAVKSERLGKGRYRVSPASPLLPGDYGVVLRPISKSKKFSGGDVARDQGAGMTFDSVWSFQVAGDAQ